MDGMNRIFRFVLCAALLLLPAGRVAAGPADDYPSGPITAVCTYSVGSADRCAGPHLCHAR